MRAAELAELLKPVAFELCSILLPNGKVNGREFEVGGIDGAVGKSLKVVISGSKTGMWCDFAGSEEEKGDLIGLIMAVKRCGVFQACDYARGFLKLNDNTVIEPILKKEYIKPIPAPGNGHEAIAYLTDVRKLSKDALDSYKVYGKIVNGEQFVCFPSYVDGECRRIMSLSLNRDENGKKKFKSTSNSEPCLFGWQAMDGTERYIIITEGQIDAMAWYTYGYKALSVPNGANSFDWIDNDWDKLSCFDTIYLSMDNDVPGKNAGKKMIQRLGVERCRVITLPFGYKDINECLMAGVTQQDIDSCVDKASCCDPDELKWTKDYAKEVYEHIYCCDESEIGVMPPWPNASNKFRFRADELSVWLGISGHGKSQILGQIMLSSVQQGKKCCIASLELKPKRFISRLVSQAGGERIPPEKAFNLVLEWFGSDICIFDVLGTAKFERLLEVFNYCNRRYGVDIFLIDSFMKLDVSEDDYRKQKDFLEKLCDFKNRTGSHVHLIVHPRKRQNELDEPGKLDVKGTGAITDLADNVFVIWRNKKKEEAVSTLLIGELPIPIDLTNEPDAILKCEKQRNGDWEGKIALWFNSSSFQFLDNQRACPEKYYLLPKRVESWFDQ